MSDISICCAVDEHELCPWTYNRGIGCKCPHHDRDLEPTK